MKLTVKAIFSEFIALILILSISPAQAAGTRAANTAVMEFLHQVFDRSANSNSPLETRIATSIAAAKVQATTLGAELDWDAVEQSLREPQAFFPASDTSFTWNGASWQADERDTYNYTGGKKNSVRTDNWTGTWNYFSLFSWSYNGSGLVTTYLYQTWDGGSSSWANNARTTSTYDGSNRLETVTTETWVDPDYVNSLRQVYGYDANDRVDTVYTQLWLGFWVDQARTINTYSGSGDLTTVLTQSSLPPTYVWTNSSLATMTYNGSHQMLTSISQIWNGSAWSNSNKWEYEYSGSDQTLARHSQWPVSAWVVYDVDTVKYNASHLVTQSVRNQILPSAQLTRENYSYDGSGNEIEEIDQTFSGTWQNNYRYVTVYTSLAAKVDETPLPGEFALLQNHPNPFNPTTTIRYSLARPAQVRIEVHNILGQLVSVLEDSEHQAGVYETTWDGRNTSGREAASGVYFYTLKSGDFVETRKMVLSR